MPNYREFPEEPPIHFIKTIKYVKDVALFLADVGDMGMGISIFDVKVAPEDMEKKIETFRTSKKIREISIPASRFLSTVEEPRRNIDHLADNNCYMGFFHCGAEDDDIFRFIVASYDIDSAERFQRRIISRVTQTFKDVHSQQDYIKAERFVVPCEKLLESKEYLQALYRSNLHRRSIAAKVFDVLEIPYNGEVDADTLDPKRTIKAIPLHDVVSSYDLVFLERKDKYSRLFRHAYRTIDLYNGAPWFLPPHRGFYSFYRSSSTSEYASMQRATSGKNSSDPELNVFVPDGAPTGTPRGFVSTSEPVDLKTENRISQKVIWASDMNIMMFGNPNLFHRVEESFTAIEEIYNLKNYRYHLFKTMALYVVPPPSDLLTLRVLVKFATRPKILINHMHYREILEMWHTILTFINIIDPSDPQSRIVFPSRKEPTAKILWKRKMLPMLSDLFRGMMEDLMNTEMEVELLHMMIHVSDAMSPILNSKVTASKDIVPIPLISSKATKDCGYGNILISDFSESDVDSIPYDAGPPKDEDGRPIARLNGGRHYEHDIPSSSDDRLGVTDVDASSAASDSDVGQRFQNMKAYRDSVQKTITTPQSAVNMSKSRFDSETSDASSQAESAAAKKRRRRKKIADTVNDRYAHESDSKDPYSTYTSGDDTIVHK